MSRVVGPEVLGRWSAGSGPLYRRLADALRTAVARGDIPADTRLPAERVLARSLNVSRSTVVSAYDLLYAEGLLLRKQGSGTRVAPQNAAAARRAHLGEVWVPQAALRSIVDTPGNLIPFTASTIDRVPGSLPADAFRVTLDEIVAHPPYFEVPEGLPQLRAELAQLYEARGLETSPDQIVVTTGAQQAIGLIAAAHLAAGDLALIESPTFPGAIDALGLTGARLRGIAVGRDGADVASIERTVVQGHVGLIYLIPTFHNPTGVLMPVSRRVALAETLSSWDVPTIDDESLLDLSLGPEPPPPLASFAPNATVYSVGSVSKLFWGGLRVGWVRCPREAVGPIMRLKSVSDLSSSLVSQTIALKLLDHREAMIKSRRQELSAKVELFRALLAQHLPSWSFDDPAGGLSLWVDTGVDSAAFAQAALREGVALATSGAMTVDRSTPTYVRIPLALDDEVIETGVERLGRAYRGYSQADELPARAPGLVV
jgi:DNA-binding transcriptional MocR family regulator